MPNGNPACVSPTGASITERQAAHREANRRIAESGRRASVTRRPAAAQYVRLETPLPTGATTGRSAAEDDPGRHHCMHIQREQVIDCGLVQRSIGPSWARGQAVATARKPIREWDTGSPWRLAGT